MHNRRTTLTLITAAAMVLAAAGAARAAVPTGDDIAKILAYEYTASRKPLAAVEEAARTANANERQAIEMVLIRTLRSPKATAACKQWTCRMLRKIGTAKSVPTLAALLGDKEMSHMARWALQGMAGDEAGAALRKALDTLSGDLKIGVVGTIGLRHDAKAVAAMGRLAAGSDKALADAALSALGMIATDEAAATLAKAKVPAALENRRLDSVLMCADAMAKAGKTRQAAVIYRGILNSRRPTPLRVAALRGVVMTEKGQAAETLARLLVTDNDALRRAAGKFIIDMPGAEATRAFAAKLPSLPPKAQLVVIGALTVRNDPAAAPAVAKAATASDAAVRLAAIEALGAIGGASEVPLLATKAVGSDSTESNAAKAALLRIKGAGAEAAVGTLLFNRSEKIRMLAATTLGQRGGQGAVDALFKAARTDRSADVRKASFDALRKQASAGKVSTAAMVGLLVEVTDASQRSAAEAAVVAAALRTGESKGQAAPVLAALRKARTSALRTSLVRVLAGIGDDDSLPAIKAALADRDADVKVAALRAAADWPNPGTLDVCLKIAQDASANRVHRILATRGFIKQIGLKETGSDSDIVALYAKAIAVALRRDEKVMALSELGKVGHEEAMALAKTCAAEAALKDAANAAIASIDRALRAPAKLSASHDGANVKNAMDGNPATRWSSGGAQQGGEWFRIDMGKTLTISGLTLDTRGSANDYPRGYAVYISNNSRSQGTLVAKGKGTNWKTEIKFRPIAGRYIRILQTGKVSGLHWSIHQLTIDARP